MQIPNELYNLLQGLCESLNDILKYPYISPTDKKLERFLYRLEKWRFEIYEQVKFLNDTYPVNIAEITKPYERLFYDKFVIVVVKIFEKRKVWDIDNRTVKPIQDGLIHGGVIRDDNLFNCCYMVQGFYSDTPHIEVSVLEADKIMSFINNNLPNINK